MTMWDKIKTAFLWVYNWITVLTASLVGLPDVLLQLVSSFGGIDFAPLVGPEMALKIVTSVAIVKALLAFMVSKLKAQAAA
jgi:hypothetical protein